MTQKRFRTLAELERQMDAARQLRAETVAGASRAFATLAGAAIRGLWFRIAARAPRQFSIATDRRAPGVDGPRI